MDGILLDKYLRGKVGVRCPGVGGGDFCLNRELV